MLKGKKILLCISGSIAAYKSPWLLRLLTQAGAEVQVICTDAALEFTTPTTLTTLSGKPIITDFYTSREKGEWVNHVKLGMWADLMLIAPATANTLADMAAGKSNSILLTTFLSARCPVWVAPAMDLDMYEHAFTRRNIEILESFGIRIFEARSGSLASGLDGKGRMQEPEEIFYQIEAFFATARSLKGKNVLITAGPTREPLDPVRYLGNRSSGHMGVALAVEAGHRGAEVTLVCGPVSVALPKHGIHIIKVETAQEMYEAVMPCAGTYDLAILAAAVADFRPADAVDAKIKKTGEEVQMRLIQNPDILKSLGESKSENQILVGFALETDKERANALDKLNRKKLDAIVLNSLQDKGAGFGTPTNKATLFFKGGDELNFEIMSKERMAGLIFDALSYRFLTT
jgi:phosphopantothenoylcysteine decarboxylase/phosphopantothenate--cysteine ligase